jgi:hypothetical protein
VHWRQLLGSLWGCPVCGVFSRRRRLRLVTEAAEFVMQLGPLTRILHTLSAAQREAVRTTLEVFFKRHVTSQGVVLPAANWIVRARA